MAVSGGGGLATRQFLQYPNMFHSWQLWKSHFRRFPKKGTQIDPRKAPTVFSLDSLSYANVQANPNAAYLFIEEGEGYVGKRLTLTKTREEDDQEKIKPLRRRNLPDECYEGKTQHLVYFRIDEVRPLIGTEQ